MTKEKAVQAIRFAAALAGLDLTYIDARGRTRQAFGGHALRVTGAQFRARHGVDTYLIQLIGRWGSNAILLYIQQAPLALQHKLASSIGHNPNVMAGQGRTAPAPALSEDQIWAMFQDSLEAIRQDLRCADLSSTGQSVFHI